jgi:hypothetical protein
MRFALALALGVLSLVAGCGGEEEETFTIYLKQRLGPEGPPGQVAPVLMPVERRTRPGIPLARQIVLELTVGPTPDERAQGFLDTLAPEVRFGSVTVRDGTALIEVSRREPDFYGTAAVVYSLTELGAIDRVELRLDGRPCCKYRHDRTVVASIHRSSYRGWQGEPCAERDRRDAVRCRS